MEIKLIIIYLTILIIILFNLNCDVTVCEYKEEDNVCEDNDDCLIAYCGVDCCACEAVLSTRQFESTYCMSRSYQEARGLCADAREKSCENMDCGITACPHPPAAKCEDGKCIPDYGY